MSEILTDLYSLFAFQYLYDSKARTESLDRYSKCFPLIENLILCDKVVLELNGVKHNKLHHVCSEFSDAFRFIEDKRLYDQTPFGDTHTVGNDFNQRAVTYADVAKDNKIYYSPHPEREQLLTDRLNTYLDQINKKVIDQFDKKILSSQEEWTSQIDVKIPPVVEHVLYFAKANNINIADSINEIRSSKNALEFRRFFSDLEAELNELTPRKRVPVRQKILGEIDEMSRAWVEDMDSEVRYRKRKIKLAKVPFIGKLLEASGLSEVVINDPILFPDKPYLLFINDLYQK